MCRFQAQRLFPFLSSIAIVAGLGITSLSGAEQQLNGHRFTLPDGFVIEQVAGPPLVDRPICADFDEAGRLYIAESSGSNEDVKVQLEKKPHRVVRLEDSDGDGRFDKGTVFADRLAFPEGTLWHDGSLYVAAPPHIWKLTDADGDGIAEKREAWFDGKTLTHCANDLHGPYLGPDGWLYWCKGAFATQTYERLDGSKFVTRAAHIFRRRPEGGLVETVMTGGMDNPVEVVFTPGGERIFSTTFLVHPGSGLRDGLIHAIYGGVYGKDQGALEGHARTGPIMPVLTHLGAAAPCGLARLETDQLGAAYRGSLLTCSFNMQKVFQHTLQPDGASYRTDVSNFLSSDNIDFHPTDVLEDADGSLLVIDTGGWYKLCCPTSQLWKPDILGAIYRVRRSGSHQVTDPRGARIAWPTRSAEHLSQLLADPRFAVRHRARHSLAQSGIGAVETLRHVLQGSADAAHRREAVWALSQIDAAQARVAVRDALADQDASVRQAALHSISAWRDRDAGDAVLKILDMDSAHNRRAAAEALGRIGTPPTVSALLDACVDVTDRVLQHSLTYAVMEIGDAASIRPALAHSNVYVRRAALIALDQMPGNQLDVADVRPLLDSDDAVLQETAWWITDQHPEWAAGLVTHFHKALAADLTDREALDRLSQRLARFAADSAIQQLMANALADIQVTNPATRVALLQAMRNSRLSGVPNPWFKPLYASLGDTDSGVVTAAVGAVQGLSDPKHGRLTPLNRGETRVEPTQPGSEPALNAMFTERLHQIAGNTDWPALLRLQALNAIAASQREIGDETTLRLLCDNLSVNQPVGIRSLAVDVLTGTALGGEQLQAVAVAMKETGAMELKQLVELFSKSTDERVGRQLVDSLASNPASSVLAVDALKAQLAGFGDTVVLQAEPLIARIESENAEKVAKIDTVLALTSAGDIRRGQQVFHSTKAACIACHRLGYLGTSVGPDLTRIGNIRTERDLLESILFPSASFVRSYEPVSIITTGGRVLNGVIRDETDQEVVVQLDAEKVTRIRHDDIEERRQGKVSIMPDGLDKHFTAQELADLVVFLRKSQ